MYTINGKFLGDKLTGMQRYAYEILNSLDQICMPGEFEIIVPEYVNFVPEYKNIKIIRFGKIKGYKGFIWEQIILPYYLVKNKRQCISLLSIIPLLYPKGIVVAHGINYKVNPQFCKSFHDKIVRLWFLINFHIYFKYATQIFTVSNFSKKEIQRVYKVQDERIVIASNAWQHMQRISYSPNTFEKYSFLYPEKYFFSMSSVNDNKNFKWIVNVAKKNPMYVFAIAGNKSLEEYLDREQIEKPDNLYFLGYVSDEDAKTLMHNCKAFLFPTFYEGFGIPPLEAMSCGAKSIVSDTPTMHEIYEKSVYYINPNNSNVILDDIIKEDVEAAHVILDKYSWDKSAKIIYNTLIK